MWHFGNIIKKSVLIFDTYLLYCLVYSNNCLAIQSFQTKNKDSHNVESAKFGLILP